MPYHTSTAALEVTQKKDRDLYSDPFWELEGVRYYDRPRDADAQKAIEGYDPHPHDLHRFEDDGGPVATAAESDPTGRSAKEPGAKLDAGKAPVLRGAIQYFPRALKAVALVSQFGAEKYTWKGWETVPEGVDRYGDACARHECDEAIGKIDPRDQRLVDLLRSLVPGEVTPQIVHASQAAWNALARLDLILRAAEAEAEEGKSS